MIFCFGFGSYIVIKIPRIRKKIRAISDPALVFRICQEPQSNRASTALHSFPVRLFYGSFPSFTADLGREQAGNQGRGRCPRSPGRC